MAGALSFTGSAAIRAALLTTSSPADSRTVTLRASKQVADGEVCKHAAPRATTIPQVSALSPHGKGRKTALWQLVGPSSEDMHTVGHKATRTMKPAIHGPSVRMSAR
jgi:hypothetical protein